jgi:hypothetical protein
VLDKGLVIAGDVRIALANVELLTIRIRLLICSVDKAEQIGLNWWKYDPHLTMQPARPLPRRAPDSHLAMQPARALPRRPPDSAILIRSPRAARIAPKRR